MARPAAPRTRARGGTRSGSTSRTLRLCSRGAVCTDTPPVSGRRTAGAAACTAAWAGPA